MKRTKAANVEFKILGAGLLQSLRHLSLQVCDANRREFAPGSWPREFANTYLLQPKLYWFIRQRPEPDTPEDTMGSMTISKAARQAGIGVETIRFYERKGLIEQPLKPQSGGYRVYPHQTVQRLCFIQQAQDLGFSLREIEELLTLRADPGSDCADVRTRAIAKLEEVEGKIARLNAMGAALKTVIAACPSSGGLDGCSIVGALESASLESGAKIRKIPADA